MAAVTGLIELSAKLNPTNEQCIEEQVEDEIVEAMQSRNHASVFTDEITKKDLLMVNRNPIQGTFENPRLERTFVVHNSRMLFLSAHTYPRKHYLAFSHPRCRAHSTRISVLLRLVFASQAHLLGAANTCFLLWH